MGSKQSHVCSIPALWTNVPAPLTIWFKKVWQREQRAKTLTQSRPRSLNPSSCSLHKYIGKSCCRALSPMQKKGKHTHLRKLISHFSPWQCQQLDTACVCWSSCDWFKEPHPQHICYFSASPQSLENVNHKPDFMMKQRNSPSSIITAKAMQFNFTMYEVLWNHHRSQRLLTNREILH